MQKGQSLNSISGDTNTTVSQLRSVVNAFVTERNWQQFHRPKNLAMSIAIEAAELMEHFQWVTHDQADQIAMDESRLCDIRDEMADVFSYLLALANALNVDLSQALADKIQKNKMKYPKDRFQGRYAPLDPDLPD